MLVSLEIAGARALRSEYCASVDYPYERTEHTTDEQCRIHMPKGSLSKVVNGPS